MKKSLVIFGLAFAACGGGNSFTGSVAGNAFTPRDAVFDTIAIEDGAGHTGTALYVIVADGTELCTFLKAGGAYKNVAVLEAELVFLDSAFTLQTPAAGKYPVSAFLSAEPGNSAEALFAKYDASCQDTLASGVGTATSGTLTLGTFKAAAGGTLDASFDLSFNGGDTGKGSISATFCQLPSPGGTACPD